MPGARLVTWRPLRVSRFGLPELIAAVSLATDLGTGQPTGHALRTCYLATELARRLGVPIQDEFDTYYVTLLRFLGCTSEASEDAALNAGDEIALYAGLAPSFMGVLGRDHGMDASPSCRGPIDPDESPRLSGRIHRPEGSRTLDPGPLRSRPDALPSNWAQRFCAGGTGVHV